MDVCQREGKCGGGEQKGKKGDLAWSMTQAYSGYSKGKDPKGKGKGAAAQAQTGASSKIPCTLGAQKSV